MKYLHHGLNLLVCGTKLVYSKIQIDVVMFTVCMDNWGGCLLSVLVIELYGHQLWEYGHFLISRVISLCNWSLSHL